MRYFFLVAFFLIWAELIFRVIDKANFKFSAKAYWDLIHFIP